MSQQPRKMKVEHLNWLMIMFDSELPQQAKLIAAYLNSKMNATQHETWPSHNTIAKATSLSRSTVIRYIDVLVSEGWLSKKTGGVFDGKNTPNHYFLNWPTWALSAVQSTASTADGDSQSSAYIDEGSVTETLGGCHPDTRGCSTDTGVVSEVDPGSVQQTHKSVNESVNESVKITTSAQAKPARAEPSPVKYSVEDYKLAEHILTGIHHLGVNTKKANMDSWADDVRKMREIDGRSHADIRRVFDWANADSFWQANILSTKKLREKYDQLSIQSKRSNGRHKGSAADLTSKNLAEAKSFMEGN